MKIFVKISEALNIGKFYIKEYLNDIKKLGKEIIHCYSGNLNEVANKIKNVIFGGRLGEYKYYDMDKVIESALTKVKIMIDGYINC